MTTCIAAICFDNETLRQNIILCSDTRSTDNATGVVSEGAVWKILPLGNGWYAMLAGSIPNAHRLYYKFRDDMSHLIEGATMADIVERFSFPVAAMKKSLMNELCISHVGLSYSEALNLTRPDTHPQLHAAIAEASIG